MQHKYISTKILCKLYSVEKNINESCYNDAFCNDEKQLKCLKNKDEIKVCQCQDPKYKWLNDSCHLVNPKTYGELCDSHSSHCVEPNTHCVNGKCLCTANLMRKDGDCRLCKIFCVIFKFLKIKF